MLTVGVEEELLLLEPRGTVRPVAAEVVRAVADPRVKPELMRFQVETSSGICTDMAELEDELVGLRRRVASAAREAGAQLVAIGAPWADEPGLDHVADDPRYRALAARLPEATATGGTCACHVHVGVDDRELAVHVAGRMRPWLPTILALGTSSPLGHGRDSGWSSTRFSRQLRWPTFRPPQVWASATDYDRTVDGLVRDGAAIDVRSVYFMARPSPRYPTLEVRVADTGLEAADAVLVAAVSRALVAVLVDDVRAGRPPEIVGDEQLDADLLSVAVRGRPPVRTSTPDDDGELETWSELAGRLLARIAPALGGDADLVASRLDRLAVVGTGADRQRRMLARTHDPAELVSAMAAATVSEPGPSEPDVPPGGAP
ncbi:YbdK family carboxylate-amine ligase [Aeromicrobium sp. IC_218]|uniref:carboxylate-amine ligase n=1 Tax=Aeromicrobium sp. IC_218 TaxID=2545468 RepID=UPI00103D614D|nr:YbdK family carboxylate-amine ligase [Aeromicrobium sp. IC_218]TCI97635.1 YbdK family carboxylate-amine ligase [Aeromicrobium sp. IC_218]